MAARRPSAALGPPPLEEDYPLAAAPGVEGGFHEVLAPARLHVFQVEHDNLYVALPREVVDKVDLVNVCLVADVDRPNYADALACYEVHECREEGPALAHNRDRPQGRPPHAGPRDEERVHPRRGVIDADAVWPDKPHAILPNHGHKLLLEAPALLARLGEPAAHDHEASDAGLARIPRYPRNEASPNRDHRELGRLRDIEETGVAP